MRKRKRNPRFEGIAKQILSEVDDWEYLSEGSYGEVYYFIIYSPLKINSIKLQSGEYVLKIEKDSEDYRTRDQIEYLQQLSDSELIPKIYFIDDKIQIMKYIEGKNLENLTKISKSEADIIIQNIENLLKKWHRLGFYHNDIHRYNIIIDKHLRVFLIDPDIENLYETSKWREEVDDFQLKDLTKEIVKNKIQNPKRLKRK